MSILLNHPEIFEHAEVVSCVVDGLINDSPPRWKKGRPDASEEDIRLHLRLIQKLGNELGEVSRYNHSRIMDYADGDLDSFNDAVRLQLQEVLLDQAPLIEAKVKDIQRSLLVVGTKQAETAINGTLSQLDQSTRESKKRLSENSWQQIAQEVLKTKKSPLHQLKNMIGLDGKALREANSFLSCETNLHRFALAERLLRKSINLFDSNNQQESVKYRLPESSHLRHRLQEHYLTARLEDEQTARLSLTRNVEEHLGEIIHELFMDHQDHSMYDFEVSQEIKNGTGVYIASQFVETLSVIPRHLHIDPGYVKLQSVDSDVTKIVMFAVVPSIKCVPELANMMEMVEERAQTDDDRSLYATDIRTLYPQRYREGLGMSPDQAADILLKPFLVPNMQEVFRARTERVDVLYPLPIGRKSYNTLDGFARTVTFEQEKVLHDSFWLYFSENRREVMNQLDNFLSGKIGTGEEAQRFTAMKNFVGATRWEKSLKTLLDQTHVAEMHYAN